MPPKSIASFAEPPAKKTPLDGNKRKDILSKQMNVLRNLPLLLIKESQISFYSEDTMLKYAAVTINNNAIKNLMVGGTVNDPKMGVLNNNDSCEYCHQLDCPGHFGRIDLRNNFVYNPVTIRDVVSVLTCVCGSCGKLLISEEKIKEKGFDKLGGDKRLRAMEEFCKDIDTCLVDNEYDSNTIQCGKTNIYEKKEIFKKGEITYRVRGTGRGKNAEVGSSNPMPIREVFKILDQISPKDAELLGFSKGTHPRDLIFRSVLVLPLIARPHNFVNGQMKQDHLSFIYSEIVGAAAGNPKDLYEKIKRLIYNQKDDKDKQPLGILQGYISIIERIQGKSALLRGLLMGKRVDYAGRTVAGPDPSLRYGQIRIPQVWTRILTKKVKVNSLNIGYLTSLLKRTPSNITHITSATTGVRQFVDPDNPKRNLKIGDTVDRWLENGDRIIINRQPTLHRQSMMAYEVVLSADSTIGLHLSYTTPMNCDFDGDENNAWNPQDFEVEAECEYLMNVKRNIMSSEQNRPIMGLVMNSITGVYLLSQASTKINPNLMKELLSLVTNQNELISLPDRLKRYNIDPFSGKAIISAILPPDFYYFKGKVMILEGVLVAGQLTKGHVGSVHRSIIQYLWKKYGFQRTADFFTDASWICNKWLIERGFSVGLLDCVSLDKKGNDRNEILMKEELAKVYVQIEALGDKVDDPIEELFRQRQLANLVNAAKGAGLKLAKETLSGDNSIATMTDQGAGTKGGIANVGQMMGAVSQQYLQGERLKPTLSGGKRLLPIYDYNDNSPEAHAFIPESFFTGLKPQGLFFLQAGGREGLLDTALKTAETGAMQHRLIKALENIIVGFDFSVRNTIGTVFLPIYNGGYEVGEMIEVDDRTRNNLSSFIDLKATITELNAKRGWVPANVQKEINGGKDINFTAKVETDFPIAPDNPKKLSKFEKSRIIGVRAIQLSNDAAPIINTKGELDPIKIAEMEYETGKLDLFIIRKFTDGSYEEVYPTKENI